MDGQDRVESGADRGAEGPLNRLVLAFDVHEVEPPDQLFGFDERAVQDPPLPPATAPPPRPAARVHPLGRAQPPRPRLFSVEAHILGNPPLLDRRAATGRRGGGAGRRSNKNPHHSYESTSHLHSLP